MRLVTLLLAVCACATPRVVEAPVVSAVAERDVSPVPPVRTTPLPPPHAEYGQLRTFHNYYRVGSVGAFRHHFVAFFHHFELVTALYEAPMEPDASVEFRGDSFGLITERPPKQGEVPPALRAMAEAIRRDLEKREKGEARAIDVRYLGAWRPVVVSEVAVRPRPGPDRFFVAGMTLAANEALTELNGVAPMSFGGGSSTSQVGDAEVPQWVDARLGRQGKMQLWKLYGTPSSFDAATRAEFDSAVLSAAKKKLAAEEGPRLEALQVERDRDVVPADVERKLTLSFYVNARAEHPEQLSARVSFDPVSAFGGVERAEFRVNVPCNDGRECSFEVEFRLHGPPLPRDVAGETEVPIVLDYAVRAPSRTTRAVQSGTVNTTARVWIDGPRAVVLSVKDRVELKPFAGVAQYREFEAHLGFMNED